MINTNKSCTQRKQRCFREQKITSNIFNYYAQEVQENIASIRRLGCFLRKHFRKIRNYWKFFKYCNKTKSTSIQMFNGKVKKIW